MILQELEVKDKIQVISKQEINPLILYKETKKNVNKGRL